MAWTEIQQFGHKLFIQFENWPKILQKLAKIKKFQKMPKF